MKNQNTIQSDIKKMRKNKQFLAILILLFIGLFFWVIVSLVTSQTSEKISPELTKLSAPLTPALDIATLEQIEQKRAYTPQELSQFTIYKVLTTRDGRSQRIVPIEVTIDDIEPQDDSSIQNQESESGTRSLLQQLDDEQDQSDESQSATDSGESAFQGEESTPTPTSSPQPSESPQTGFGSQL